MLIQRWQRCHKRQKKAISVTLYTHSIITILALSKGEVIQRSPTVALSTLFFDLLACAVCADDVRFVLVTWADECKDVA